MPLLNSRLDLNDPSVDTTLTHCGNSLFVEEARADYVKAFARAMEYATVEQLPGDVMEFGTYSGFTARILAEAMTKYGHAGSLHLFDSFEGFPTSTASADNACLKVAVQGYWENGKLSAPMGIERHIFDRLSPLLPPGRLFVHKGFFNNTLPQAALGRKVSLVHIDSDLYASARYVLDALCAYGCLQDGVVLLFDDFFCNRANPNFGEQAALRDFLAANPRFAVSPWFTYGWDSAAYFLHDTTVTDQTSAACS